MQKMMTGVGSWIPAIIDENAVNNLAVKLQYPRAVEANRVGKTLELATQTTPRLTQTPNFDRSINEANVNWSW